jgi:hypothetical protein
VKNVICRSFSPSKYSAISHAYISDQGLTLHCLVLQWSLDFFVCLGNISKALNMELSLKLVFTLFCILSARCIAAFSAIILRLVFRFGIEYPPTQVNVTGCISGAPLSRTKTPVNHCRVFEITVGSVYVCRLLDKITIFSFLFCG